MSFRVGERVRYRGQAMNSFVYRWIADGAVVEVTDRIVVLWDTGNHGHFDLEEATRQLEVVDPIIAIARLADGTT